MGCFSCFKPSNTLDTFEAETDIALEVSRHEAEVQEAEQLASALRESSRLLRQQKEEQEEEERRRRRDRALENDEQLARAYQYEEEREMQMYINNTSAVEEEEQLALALQESYRLLRQKEKEEEGKNRARELEKDAQIANGVLYEERERERQIAKSVEKEKERRKKFEEQVKKDAQIAKDLKREEFEEQARKDKQIAKDLKRKQFEEQVKKDAQIAKDLKRKQFEEQAKKDKEMAKDLKRKQVEEQVKKDAQIAKDLKIKQCEEQVKNDEQIAKELQNQPSEIAYEESSGLRDNNSVSSETAEKSLKEIGKGKQFEENNNISTRTLLDEDEQLAEVIWESLKDKGKGKQSKDDMEEDEKLPDVIPPRSICGGCDSEIEHGKSVDISGVLWHSVCLWCDACHQPISTQEVEIHVNARGKYHKSCYERYCYICKEKKMRRYNEHPFWKERYCPTHESDTHKCCSCERLEPRGTNYVMLGDTRWLCLECMESAIMDSHECQHLHFEIREYFEGLNMKIEKEFPFLLVEKQALNKAEKKEKIRQDYNYEVVTRGICLSEPQTVTSVSKATRTGPRKEKMDTVTESQPVYSDCPVTAILILYGLPRLFTGYILAHEMMHAYLRLNGQRKLNIVREEGLCQVLGHMWLESQTYASSDAAIAAEAASSSSRTPLAAANTSKKGKWTGFEKKLVEFCKNQIETDESLVYGVGFRRVNEMVTNSSLKETLKEIIRLG